MIVSMRKQKIASKKLQDLDNKYYPTGKYPIGHKYTFENYHEKLKLTMPKWANIPEKIEGVWFWRE